MNEARSVEAPLRDAADEAALSAQTQAQAQAPD